MLLLVDTSAIILHLSFVTWMTGMTLLVGITGKPFRSSTTDVTSWPPPSLKWATVCLNILDSAKAEYCTSFHFSSVRPCTGGTSQFFSMYKGIYAIRIITGPIKPYMCIRKPFLPGYLSIPEGTRPQHTTPDHITKRQVCHLDFSFVTVDSILNFSTYVIGGV